MRFMILVKANADSEAGKVPAKEAINEMGKYNSQLMKAGVLLAGEGIHPSSKGARVKLSATGAAPSVTDGPFAETKELISGFWILQVTSRDEAIEWAKRIPNPTDDDFEVEVRQVFDAEDFGEEFSPEAREAEARMRASLERK